MKTKKGQKSRHICQSCGYTRFKTVQKGRAWECRRCGAVKR